MATAAGYLTWAGVSLTHAAFQPKDLRPLKGRQTRGGNLPIGGVVGRTAYAPVGDQIDATIAWVVRGDVAHTTGALAADARSQLDINLAYYEDLFMDSGDADTGLVTATLVFPSRTLTAQAQCWDWDERSNVKGNLAQVVTRIVIPAGAWAVV